ncbi:hypothetical protein AB0M38_14270 [Streptomyces sp. NPDC051742]|uniref:TetR/AcrR family transcriptional regulator n=1 Tax=unclassified Streptomyces TaxID=2593676 RepID=UPI003432E4BC
MTTKPTKSTRGKKAGGGGKEARRAELAEAVQRALLTRGLEGLRLRDVADEAGVTPAAVLYYGDLDALVHETYQQAITRYSQDREAAADGFADARLKLRACIGKGVAAGPDDALTRLLFEYWPRCLRDAKAAALDSALTERQISVYAEILVLGRAQGHFVLQDPPRLIAANFVAMEDGYQMEVLAGRRSRAEVIAALSSYARAVTGYDPGAADDEAGLRDARSDSWALRAAAGRRLAASAEDPAAAEVLRKLLLDGQDTAVTRETAEALLERWDVHGLRLVLAAFADADDNTADYLDGAISDVCCQSDEDFERLRELVSTLPAADADPVIERQAARILGGGGTRR